MQQETPDSPEKRPTRSDVGRPPKPAGIMGAFRVNRQKPYPWNRAISAGLSAGTPILIGIGLGHFTYGLLATLGGFAYLYTSGEPYARRAVKLLLVMAAMAVSFGAGSFSAALSFWFAALMLGVVGAAAVFICEALGVPPPSALFFVLTCAAGTSMPVADPAGLLMRSALIFLGGVPAWLISMSGWIVDPRGPETAAVAKTYRALAAWISAVGTGRLHAAQHDAAMALRASETALSAAGTPFRRVDTYLRLRRLNEQADAIFLAIIELTVERCGPVDPKLTAAVRSLADAVGDPDRASCLMIPQPSSPGPSVENLVRQLTAAVAIATDEEPAPVRTEATRGNVRAALAGALDRKSLVVPKALRFGGMLIVSYLVAYAWRAHRPYWVFVSTAAVMMGPTATATLHRALQRAAGTIVGACLSASILSLRPTGIIVAAEAFVFQSLAQLMLVRNYAFTVAFITPLGLLIAHGGHPELSTSYLIVARLVDILLGCALGLAGTALIGRRSSSKLLPTLLSDTLRAEGRLLEALLSDPRGEQAIDRHDLQTSLLNLRLVYDTALNELARDKSQVESLWPAVIAIQRLGFFLIAMTDDERRERVSDESLSQLKGVFDTLATAVTNGRPPKAPKTPIIPEYPVISQELHEITQGLRVLQLS